MGVGLPTYRPWMHDLHTSIRIDLRSSIPEAQAAVEAGRDLPPSNRPKPKRKRMDVSENRGDFPPKWMVKIKEKPIKHGMIWGYHYFWKHPNLPTIHFSGAKMLVSGRVYRELNYTSSTAQGGGGSFKE